MSQRITHHVMAFFMLVLFFCLTSSSVRADVSRKQAQKLISRAAGFNLPSSAVRINSVNMTAADTAEVNAELELVFRLVQNTDGVWSVKEIRSGQDAWEDVAVISAALKLELRQGRCVVTNAAGTPSSKLSADHSRCLLANLFSIPHPSDAVRIKEFSTLGLPVGTETSALVVASVRADFRLHRESSSWMVNGFKSGNREWIVVSGVTGSIDATKRAQAMEEMKMMASALESYRKERGQYVASDKQSVLIDHLSPRYLSKVLRLDPWHHPYRYQGEPQHFTLRSLGPDGNAETADDISLTSSFSNSSL